MINYSSDEEAIAVLNEYRSIVRHIARLTICSSDAIDLQDLCQVGEIAVLDAVKSYDPSCGTTIKSFVSKVVRQAIFREAAMFLGVFTVDSRSTRLAAKFHRLSKKGYTDKEIADRHSDTNTRVISADYVHELRIAYSRRNYIDVNEDVLDNTTQEGTIRMLLNDVIKNNLEQTILNERILGHATVKQLSIQLGVSQKQFYELENQLKDRIQIAIEDIFK